MNVLETLVEDHLLLGRELWLGQHLDVGVVAQKVAKANGFGELVARALCGEEAAKRGASEDWHGGEQLQRLVRLVSESSSCDDECSIVPSLGSCRNWCCCGHSRKCAAERKRQSRT